jgi:hypothetical protein
LPTVARMFSSLDRLTHRRRAHTAAPSARLPKGAEAALLSVTEVLPDPRNHLAIKDPTSELRLTPQERQAAAEAAAQARTVTERPAERAAAEKARAARVAALAKHEAKHEADPSGTVTSFPTADTNRLTDTNRLASRAAELAAQRAPVTKAG